MEVNGQLPTTSMFTDGIIHFTVIYFLKQPAERERERERNTERESERWEEKLRRRDGKRNTDREMGREIQRQRREKRRDLPTFQLSTILVISNMPHDFRKP